MRLWTAAFAYALTLRISSEAAEDFASWCVVRYLEAPTLSVTAHFAFDLWLDALPLN